MWGDIEKEKWKLDKNEHNFCCNKCVGEYFSGENNPNYIERILVKCNNCGKNIEKQKWQLNKNGVHLCCNKCVGKYFSGENNSNYGKQWTEEEREKASANKQGIPYNGHEEFPGFTNKSRPHLTPIHACIQLNQRFPGSEGHHIMSSVVIFIPKNLHRSNYHNFKTGNGMDEINELAFNFLLGA